MATQQPNYQRLAQQQALGDANGEAFFQCVIVGSGYGGAVMAARLSPHFAPGQLAVLERGKEYQPGDYPSNLREAVRAIRTARQPLGMYDFAFSSDMDSLTANALGGGSNICANVILEPWPEVFNTCMDPDNPSKSRCWPRAINDTALKPYFARVRQMLAVEKYIDCEDLAAGVTLHDPLLNGSPFYGAEEGNDPATGQPLRDYRGRTFAERPPLSKATYLRDALDHMQMAAEEPRSPTSQADSQLDWVHMRNGNYQPNVAAHGEFRKAPIAVNLTLVEDGQPNAVGVPQSKCTLCGDCVTGCNVGAKNGLTMNYLPLARQHGAAIFTQVEVQSIHPSDRPGYRYRLQVLRRTYKGNKLQNSSVQVYTPMLVLSAGVFGTVKLLLNAQQRGEMTFSAQLGQRFSGNADAIAVSYNGQRRLDSLGYGRHDGAAWEAGPTVTAMADFRRVPGRHHLVQDAAFPSLLVKTTRRLFALANLWKADARIWRDLLRQDLQSKREGALNHSQVWLCMGHDAAAGELWCDRKGDLRLTWLDAGTQQVHAATRKSFQLLARLMGASLITNPRDQRWFVKKTATPITVHPLGGCCMAEDSGHGVTDHVGRVFQPQGGVYAGLYISDGSLCDASLGANPSLTIAALAERAAEQIVTNDLSHIFSQIANTDLLLATLANAPGDHTRHHLPMYAGDSAPS
jgi:cholesterol oxidase